MTRTWERLLQNGTGIQKRRNYHKTGPIQDEQKKSMLARRGGKMTKGEDSTLSVRKRERPTDRKRNKDPITPRPYRQTDTPTSEKHLNTGNMKTRQSFVLF